MARSTVFAPSNIYGLIIWSNLKIFKLKNFRGGPMKIYMRKHLTHEYFYTRKYPDLRYSTYIIFGELITNYSNRTVFGKFKNAFLSYVYFCFTDTLESQTG